MEVNKKWPELQLICHKVYWSLNSCGRCIAGRGYLIFSNRRCYYV